jgi:hypothetical protein
MAELDDGGSGRNHITRLAIFIVPQMDQKLGLRIAMLILRSTAAEAEGIWFATRSEWLHIFSTSRKCSGTPDFQRVFDT